MRGKGERMNNIFYRLWDKITSYIVKKQTLSGTKDGRFICSQGGKEYIADSLLDGLANDKKWKRIK